MMVLSLVSFLLLHYLPPPDQSESVPLLPPAQTSVMFLTRQVQVMDPLTVTVWRLVVRSTKMMFLYLTCYLCWSFNVWSVAYQMGHCLQYKHIHVYHTAIWFITLPSPSTPWPIH